MKQFGNDFYFTSITISSQFKSEINKYDIFDMVLSGRISLIEEVFGETSRGQCSASE